MPEGQATGADRRHGRALEKQPKQFITPGANLVGHHQRAAGPDAVRRRHYRASHLPRAQSR